MVQDVAILGQGALASRLCGRLAARGWRVRCWPRPLDGAEPAANPAEAVVPGGLALSLLDDEALLERATVAGDGLLGGLGPGGVHLVSKSASPPLVRRLAAAHEEHGSALLGALLLGEPATIAVAGPLAARRQARRLLAALAADSLDLGPDPAAAMVAGLAADLVAAAAAEALREAGELAGRHGLASAVTVPLLRRVLSSADAATPGSFLRTARRALAMADEVDLALPMAGLLREQALQGR